MSGIKSERFNAGDLRLVRSAPPPDDPPLIIGDICELNSGSPSLLVVAAATDEVTVAWRDGAVITEVKMPRACVRRI